MYRKEAPGCTPFNNHHTVTLRGFMHFRAILPFECIPNIVNAAITILSEPKSHDLKFQLMRNWTSCMFITHACVSGSCTSYDVKRSIVSFYCTHLSCSVKVQCMERHIDSQNSTRTKYDKDSTRVHEHIYPLAILWRGMRSTSIIRVSIQNPFCLLECVIKDVCGFKTNLNCMTCKPSST